jgi:hypothetical protein
MLSGRQAGRKTSRQVENQIGRHTSANKLASRQVIAQPYRQACIKIYGSRQVGKNTGSNKEFRDIQAVGRQAK